MTIVGSGEIRRMGKKAVMDLNELEAKANGCCLRYIAELRREREKVKYVDNIVSGITKAESGEPFMAVEYHELLLGLLDKIREDG